MRRPALHIRVDTTNPGQFFACCGLLELANRLWPGSEGWFSDGRFVIWVPANGDTPATLKELLTAIVQTDFVQLDPDDETSSPVRLGSPIDLVVDWWRETREETSGLKLWAGRMSSVRIARAMRAALAGPEFATDALFDVELVVFDPLAPDNKVEPFYFDARRGANARPVDVGFSTDVLEMTSGAYPAVEFLCFVGLQRFRPQPVKRRVFRYSTWSVPLEPCVAAAAAAGALPVSNNTYEFASAFRTDQRKHKAFTQATGVTRSQR